MENKGQKNAADRGVLSFKTRLEKRTKSKPLPENDHHKRCKRRATKATTAWWITKCHQKHGRAQGGFHHQNCQFPNGFFDDLQNREPLRTWFEEGSRKDQRSIFAWSRPLGGALRSRSIRIDKKEGGTKDLTRHGPKAWRI